MLPESELLAFRWQPSVSLMRSALQSSVEMDQVVPGHGTPSFFLFFGMKLYTESWEWIMEDVLQILEMNDQILRVSAPNIIGVW